MLFAFFPSAFVLSMVYADALFVASRLCLLALLDGRWLAAGAAAAAAGLVRPTAVALCVACAWGAVVGHPGRQARGVRWSRPRSPPWVRSSTWGTAGSTRGDALAFFEVESRGWGNHLDLGASNIRAALRHVGEMR